MKELNQTEIAAVSGAGVFSDAGSAIGKGVGTIVGHFRKTETGADNGAKFGETIGNMIDQTFSMFTSRFKK